MDALAGTVAVNPARGASQAKQSSLHGCWKLRAPEGVLGGAMREASRGCAIAVEAHAWHKLLRATAGLAEGLVGARIVLQLTATSARGRCRRARAEFAASAAT